MSCRELEASGVRVTVASAYRTALVSEGSHQARALLEAREIDRRHVHELVDGPRVRRAHDAREPSRLLDGVVVAAIGPVTAETAAEHGLRVSVMPNEYTVPALADAIADYFATSPPAAVRS